MINLAAYTTEKRNSDTVNLDNMSSMEIAMVANKEDENVVKAVQTVIPQIADTIDMAAETLDQQGRLIYIGAGTSGRLGVLDASECPPTFGVSEGLVIGIIAGGREALFHAVEGAEDSKTLAEEELKKQELTSRDMVIGLSASGRTPYVFYGLKYAASIGCKTAVIACNKDSIIGKEADIAIEPVTGPEILTGSTRLKAGTAQKMILNMISTGSMVKIGKVYENLMVDLQNTNEKLGVRTENIVMSATGSDRETARQLLKEADGSAKLAITMFILDKPGNEAKDILKSAHGSIRKAIRENKE
ncbi:N-acetylmuramic acid 6-phosphate etherase [Mobilisporobacter senegalensis]|uniref:N-acetylmuramic acid 6-phosphate etherase n=1 Tax=Mobilisporobacter senegalensis TaxID=1329262 RepID=A0A3N1Y2U8_9FIRM|nr:N-acetylmuramic acid 6-phosphate etherase [Mobilisporobacter senegalensis]ROR31597.1 N-acetylmuramic acid 6-phosphate etherase [Mobilisporobacter senegalensis]